MTKQRLLVKNIVVASCEHPTAERIYEIAKQRMPSISLSTVYRNLGLLCDAREIRQISVKGYPDCYDQIEHPHGHLICQCCGKVKDIEIDDLSEELSKKLGVEIISYDVSASYLCENCKGYMAQA